MNNNPIKITVIVCSTALVLFLLYQLVFSPYARCVSAGKEEYNLWIDDLVKTSPIFMTKLKAKCSRI